MEGALEADDVGAAGIGAGDLDGVLNRFGAGRHEQALLVAGNRRHGIELFGKFFGFFAFLFDGLFGIEFLLLADFDALIAADPSDHLAHFRRSETLLALNRPKDALAELVIARDLGSERADETLRILAGRI